MMITMKHPSGVTSFITLMDYTTAGTLVNNYHYTVNHVGDQVDHRCWNDKHIIVCRIDPVTKAYHILKPTDLIQNEDRIAFFSAYYQRVAS
jgi:hypothetical protein